MRTERKLIIVAGILVLLLIFGFLALEFGKSENIPFESVSKGVISIEYLNNETYQPLYTVFTNKSELDHFSNKYGLDVNFSDDEFKEYILICAYLGMISNVEFKELNEARIKKITLKDNTVEILVQIPENKPIDAFTTPYHIVKVKRDYFENKSEVIFVFRDTGGRELNTLRVKFG